MGKNSFNSADGREQMVFASEVQSLMRRLDPNAPPHLPVRIALDPENRKKALWAFFTAGRGYRRPGDGDTFVVNEGFLPFLDELGLKYEQIESLTVPEI